jgi:hypothetical protein
MTNDEITEYMHGWVANMKAAPSKESSIMGAVIGVTVMLAEIAKRLPQAEPNELVKKKFKWETEES